MITGRIRIVLVESPSLHLDVYLRQTDRGLFTWRQFEETNVVEPTRRAAPNLVKYGLSVHCQIYRIGTLLTGNFIFPAAVS